jgi:hypothetical protein
MDGDGDLDAVALGVAGAAGLAWFENFDLVDADYGDAPTPFPTTRGDDGAVHGAGGPSLGALRNAEAEGAPAPHADAHADDDGVTWDTLQVGQPVVFNVAVANAPQGALLDAWIDLDGDGSWLGAGEHIVANRAVTEGVNQIITVIPANARAGETFARFRIRSAGEVRTGGAVLDGEVEDYAMNLAPAAPGTGAWGVSHSLSPNPPPFGEALTRPADIDGDGDVDVLFGGSPTGWQENDGAGHFTFHPLNMPGTIVDAQVVDLDDDGDQDFVVSVGFTVYWIEVRPGLPLIPHALPVDFGGFASSTVPNLTVVDLDGDGDRDVVATHANAGLVWWVNDGAQTFVVRQLFTATAVGDFEVADFDRDGDLDFVVGTNSSLTKLSWYERQGGDFVEHALMLPLPTARPAAIVAGDIDADGDVDLVVEMFSGSSTFYLYANGGAGGFAALQITGLPFLGGPAPTNQSMSMADLNGDGRLDVLHTTQFGASFWLRSLPGGGFARQSLPPGQTSSSIYQPQAADFDGDGDLDYLRGSRWFAQVPRGDYDGDADVDGNDFLRWQRQLGRLPGPDQPYPDGDLDGDVDAADLQLWRDNFDAGAEPPPEVVRAAGIEPARVTTSPPSNPLATGPALPANVILSLNVAAPFESSRSSSGVRPQFRPVLAAPGARDAALAVPAAEVTSGLRRPAFRPSIMSGEDDFPPELLDEFFAGL